MNKSKKDELIRFGIFSLANIPSTATDLVLVWVLSELVFTSYVGCYVVAPVVGFIFAMLMNFWVYSRFVWKGRDLDSSRMGVAKRLLKFCTSVLTIFVARMGVIQVLGLLTALPAVVCDLGSMLFSGIMNFLINEKWVFKKGSRPIRLSRRARFLRKISKPFLRVKVEGLEHLQEADGPKIFVCNHGFWYGPIVAAAYLPVGFRPWIHDKVLERKAFEEEVCKAFEARWHKIGEARKHRMARRLYGPTQWVLGAFKPISVTRGVSKNGHDSIQKSLEALADGQNLLIFPELPRRHDAEDFSKEVAESGSLRGFYTGFAQIGKEFYQMYGKRVNFYPLYADQKNKVLSIGEPVAYDPLDEEDGGKRKISEMLHEKILILSHKRA